jgi:putative endonuclease
MGAFVYMLRCADGSYYVGSARNDLERRVAEHQAGVYQGYTSAKRPVHLVWSEYFDQIRDAIAAERKIKGWSRAKKEALIRGDWIKIKLLARRRAGKPKSSS